MSDTPINVDEFFEEHGFRRSSQPFNSDKAQQALADMTSALQLGIHITTLGWESFIDPNPEGDILRHAAYSVIIRVAEASHKLHSDVKLAHDTIPWNIIAQMRNRIVHIYNEIDNSTVWATLTTDFPELLIQIKSIDLE